MEFASFCWQESAEPRRPCGCGNTSGGCRYGARVPPNGAGSASLPSPCTAKAIDPKPAPTCQARRRGWGPPPAASNKRDLVGSSAPRDGTNGPSDSERQQGSGGAEGGPHLGGVREALRSGSLETKQTTTKPRSGPTGRATAKAGEHGAGRRSSRRRRASRLFGNPTRPQIIESIDTGSRPRSPARNRRRSACSLCKGFQDYLDRLGDDLLAHDVPDVGDRTDHFVIDAVRD